nr:hypothetical protein [Tanacetum cinerariifolium]
MTTLAKHIIVAGAENRPLMLEKSMYNSRASRIRLFIKRKKHGRMMLDSIDNDDCDVQATNIILHGLSPDVYALVNHQEAAKDIWDRVKMLMKGIELSYQECECRLYNLFDKFAYVQGETLYEYYWRFSQLINDIHTIGMTMQQVQVNTKFLNALPSEWSKFVTDVKLAKSLYTINYDQLYAYLSQHKRHANKVRIMRERYLDPLEYRSQLSNSIQSISVTTTFRFINQQEDPIKCINKAMAFLSAVASSYNYQGEGHMARLCIQPKWPRNAAWFKKKLMLAEAQEAGQILDEEQLAFLADPGISEAPVSQQTIPHSSAFQTDDLDAYDMDCDDLSSAKADTNPSTPNDLLVLSLVEQITDHVANLDKEIQTNKMVNESLTAELERYKERIAIFEQRLNVDLNKRENLIDSQMDDLIRERNAKLAAFNRRSTLLKKLFLIMSKKDSLSKTLTVFKTESKEKASKYIDKEIVLENQNKELESIICKMYRSTQAMHMITKPQVFYDDTHKQALEHAMISVLDDEETLILEEESRSKMLDKQNDPISIEKRLRTDNDQLLNQIMSQEIVHNVVNSTDILDVKKSCVNDCRKNVINIVVSKPNATLAPGMFKLDIKPISPRLKNNTNAHEVYIEKTIEYADILCGFVKRARTQYPSEPLLESACMFTKHVQELLVYASKTCPNSPKPSEKLVAVTPINKDKRVRFVKPVTSLSNIPKQTDSLYTKDSNKPLLTSTGVKPTTSASGSKPSGNIKNNRIT